MTSEIVTVRSRPIVEKRWRWSWRRMHWEVQVLSEDFRFVYSGAFLWGMESFEALR